MITLSNENISALLALCAGNTQVTGEFPSQRPVTQSFDIFFYLRLNKRLSKQSRSRLFGMPSRLLWRHCNAPKTSLHELSNTWMKDPSFLNVMIVTDKMAKQDILNVKHGPLYMYSIIQCGHNLILTARFMGPTWDPSGADRTQVGPMLAPWTLLSG